MVSLAFDITVADFEAFNLHIADAGGERARRLRNHLLFVAVMAALLTAYYAWSGVLDSESDLALLYGFPFAVPVLGLVVYEALRPWLIRRQLRRVLGRAPRDAFLGRKHLEATGTGLTITAETSTTRCDWAAITRAEETPGHLFLMLGNASGIIIPKRGQPEAGLAALRGLLDAHLGRGAAGRG